MATSGGEMDGFKRYGLYVVPEGELFAAGSAWLGWDSAAGGPVVQPEVAGLDVAGLTATPRKYGFHGTIKPPFALALGQDIKGLHGAAEAFCEGRAPVVIPALEVRRLGGFVALVPQEPAGDLAELAGACVAALDDFRAPPSEAELAKRRKSGLSARQEEMLQRWGYPHVMAEFRFHMTLTGRTPDAEAVRDALATHFAPILAAPFEIGNLALMGEDAAGVFHVLHRYALSG